MHTVRTVHTSIDMMRAIIVIVSQKHGRVSGPQAERAPVAVRLLRAAELRDDVSSLRAVRQQGRCLYKGVYVLLITVRVSV